MRGSKSEIAVRAFAPRVRMVVYNGDRAEGGERKSELLRFYFESQGEGEEIVMCV